MTNPNHAVMWPIGRPEFSITCTRSTSTNRGYHESDWEIVSKRELDKEDFARLDDCGLLGMGQSYSVVKHEPFDEVVQPAVVDRRTGKVVEGAVPTGYNGKPYTATHTYNWQRYVVRRICDSGD